MYLYKKNIKYFLKNNKSKKTILFIHGFGSSNEFAKKLYKLKNQYNILSLDLYNKNKEDEIVFEKMIEKVKFIIRKIKSKTFIIFAHSLGGGIVNSIYEIFKEKIEKIIWMSTINPSMLKDIKFITLKNHHKENGNKLLKIITNKLERDAEKELDPKKKWMEKFLKKDSCWAIILKKTIFNDEFMQKLEQTYFKTKDKSIYIIGKKDFVINTKLFTFYLKKINKTPHFIGEGHNPIIDNPEKINELLNSLIKTKPYLFKRRILKY